MRFTLTGEHIKLLRSMNVGWQDCEYGAPEIDPKRPYGNSSVELDIAEILGWELGEDDDDELTDEQRERAATLHRETQTALQVVLHTLSLEPGTYTNRDRSAPYGVTYVRDTTPTSEAREP